jgi:hypothetical protein
VVSQRSIGVMVMAAVALAACGGSSKSATETTAGASTTLVAPANTGYTLTAEETKTYCDEAKKASGITDAFNAALAGSQGVDVQRAYDAYVAEVDLLSKAAPGSLSADLGSTIAALKSFAPILAKAKFDFATASADPEARKIFNDQVNAASIRINDFNKSSCGILPKAPTISGNSTATTAATATTK